jgi:hypothetical protein
MPPDWGHAISEHGQQTVGDTLTCAGWSKLPPEIALPIGKGQHA